MSEKENRKQRNFREKVFRMVSVGVVDEPVNQAYDVISTGALLVNLTVAIMNTYDGMHEKYGHIFVTLEAVTVFFFLIDYILRLYTAQYLFAKDSELTSLRKYVLSFSGIVDLLSFLPYYMPVFFPSGASVFRIFRVVRILRLFRINAYYDSLNVITDIISKKKQQLLSSVFIIIVFMVGASLCMYSLENKAQPEVFTNAFSGIWWAASTLLTVGYGDIYPVTTAGKFMGIVIAFLGVGMVAIPTGIISAGFVERYQSLAKRGRYDLDQDIPYIQVQIDISDNLAGKRVKDLHLLNNMVVAEVVRNNRRLKPEPEMKLKEKDVLIIYSRQGGEDYD